MPRLDHPSLDFGSPSPCMDWCKYAIAAGDIFIFDLQSCPVYLPLKILRTL